MTEQLKPCPFCGGLAKAYERTCDKSDRYDPSHRAYPIVRCGSCGCCAEGKDWTEPDTAIEAWNRRVHPAQPGAEPAPSAVVCGRCDGTGLDARYCNYQCEKCDGSGQAGAEPVAWTARELELIDGMIEVQLHHAQQCDRIANRPMAEKQKAWDMERVALLRKIRNAAQKGGA